MSPQEIQYAKQNTKLLSIIIQFIEFITDEIKDKQE